MPSTQYFFDIGFRASPRRTSIRSGATIMRVFWSTTHRRKGDTDRRTVPLVLTNSTKNVTKPEKGVPIKAWTRVAPLEEIHSPMISAASRFQIREPECLGKGHSGSRAHQAETKGAGRQWRKLHPNVSPQSWLRGGIGRSSSNGSGLYFANRELSRQTQASRFAIFFLRGQAEAERWCFL
jgi:hypothetical protein